MLQCASNRMEIIITVGGTDTLNLAPTLKTLYFTIRETCFCTISNYPLHFGQTSLYWDIEENGENTLLIIYPNPVSDRLNIHYSPDVTPKAVELYDLQGRLIKTQDSNLENIGMENVPAGNYTLRVVMERGENYTEKVVKAH